MNGELHEGSTDGKYRKAHVDRGGHVDTASDMNRSHLHSDYGYGFPLREVSPKVSPDGKIVP